MAKITMVLAATVIVACAATISGCSSTDSADCLPVSSAVVEQIGLGAPGDHLNVEKSAAVRNEDADTYWVALRVKDSAGTTSGVWSVPSLDTPGPVLSVDNVAAVLTQWPQIPNAAGTTLRVQADDCVT